MNPDQAIQILYAATAGALLTRKQHEQVIQALNTLEAAIKQEPQKESSK
jgi:hypothetical protein